MCQKECDLKSMKKILVIRLSSIGDVVLTSPVVRCLKNNGFQVHFLIKEKFYPVIQYNPYIDKVHFFSNLLHTASVLRQENYDYIVDLQNNWKSRILSILLHCPAYRFPKLNIRKWLVVYTKRKNLLPAIHIVDRYFKATEKLNVYNDGKGLDFFINENEVREDIKAYQHQKYVVLVTGGSYYTKQIPVPKIIEILQRFTHHQFVCIGDKKDGEKLESIQDKYANVINLCGKTNLFESAYLIRQAQCVITTDTGMMHIAAAFHKKIFSIWGNTIPQFGMYPYMSADGSKIIENNKIWCRPCSKLGYSYCPLIHFSCMRDIDVSEIECM